MFFGLNGTDGAGGGFGDFLDDGDYGWGPAGPFRRKRSWKVRERNTDVSGKWWSHKMARVVLKRLKPQGAYVYSVGGSYKGGNPSVYIKFASNKLRSLRIGDHPGINKYTYKWNLRSDYKENSVENDRGYTRYYHNEVEELCSHIYNYSRKAL